MECDVDRQQAMQITQKSASAFSSKICRSGIKSKKIHTYKYNDMLDIKNKVRQHSYVLHLNICKSKTYNYYARGWHNVHPHFIFVP